MASIIHYLGTGKKYNGKFASSINTRKRSRMETNQTRDGQRKKGKSKKRSHKKYKKNYDNGNNNKYKDNNKIIN